MYLKAFAVIATSLILGACKIQIDVPEGGQVVSASGAFDCASGETCTIDVSDIHFDETFSAVAADNYDFMGWARQDRGFCGDSLNDCRLFTTAFAGFEVLLALLANPEEIYYLAPVFEHINAAPTTGFKPFHLLELGVTENDDGDIYRYQFHIDGTYTASYEGQSGTGTYRLALGNKVLEMTEVAGDEAGDDHPEFAVFRSYEDGRYNVCYYDDETVRKPGRALKLCTSGELGYPTTFTVNQ